MSSPSTLRDPAILLDPLAQSSRLQVMNPISLEPKPAVRGLQVMAQEAEGEVGKKVYSHGGEEYVIDDLEDTPESIPFRNAKPGVTFSERTPIANSAHETRNDENFKTTVVVGAADMISHTKALLK